MDDNDNYHVGKEKVLEDSDGMEIRESPGRRTRKNYRGRLNFEAEEKNVRI